MEQYFEEKPREERKRARDRERMRVKRAASRLPGPPVPTPTEPRRLDETELNRIRRKQNATPFEVALVRLHYEAVALEDEKRMPNMEDDTTRLREYYQLRRVELLDQVAPDRRCWWCGELKVGTRQLTVLRRVDVMGATSDDPEKLRAVCRRATDTTDFCLALCLTCRRRHLPGVTASVRVR